MVTLHLILHVKKLFLGLDADGIMIGRGSYGKPWIFEIIKNSTSIKDF